MLEVSNKDENDTPPELISSATTSYKAIVAQDKIPLFTPDGTRAGHIFAYDAKEVKARGFIDYIQEGY